MSAMPFLIETLRTIDCTNRWCAAQLPFFCCASLSLSLSLSLSFPLSVTLPLPPPLPLPPYLTILFHALCNIYLCSSTGVMYHLQVHVGSSGLRSRARKTRGSQPSGVSKIKAEACESHSCCHVDFFQVRKLLLSPDSKPGEQLHSQHFL